MKEEDLKNMLLDLTVEMVKDPYACVSDYLFALGKLYEIMMSDIGARREAIRLIEEFLEGRKSGKNWQGFSGLVFDLSEVLRRIRKEEEERERKKKREEGFMGLLPELVREMAELFNTPDYPDWLLRCSDLLRMLYCIDASENEEARAEAVAVVEEFLHNQKTRSVGERKSFGWLEKELEEIVRRLPPQPQESSLT
ncbi:hypothetical protein [Thermocrinis sp.]|jgi:hypothetical protein|uniref:hypothetical protein n=1 Tax=Thermocrinis sp. TaxID=2024383 RepID=UPI003C05E299